MWAELVQRFYARSLVSPDVNSLQALVWGPQDWDAALEELLKLKELVDANTFMPMLQQLQQRTWLMHWGLFVFFNHENGRNLIIDNLFQDRCGMLSFFPRRQQSCAILPLLVICRRRSVQRCTRILQ